MTGDRRSIDGYELKYCAAETSREELVPQSDLREIKHLRRPDAMPASPQALTFAMISRMYCGPNARGAARSPLISAAIAVRVATASQEP